MTIDLNKYIILLSHCIFIDGAKRSIIYDIQRNNFEVIPKDISEIVKKFKGKRIENVYKEYGIDNKEELDDYFNFLIEKEYIFLSDHAEDANRFLPLNLKYDTYSIIHNAIIDIGENSFIDINKILAEIELLNCQNIQLRIFYSVQLDYIRSIVSQFDETQIKNVEIIVPYFEEAGNLDFEMFFVEFQRLGSITFYNSPKDFSKNYLKDLSSVHFVSYNYTDKKFCGAINTSFFCPNIPHYIESHNHNTCLNRKISIDVDGNIKNCPIMDENFGNIRDTTLAEAIEKPGFKKYWNITKEKIDVCKDCEYRYICNDCRIYLENPKDIYSKPLKCGYNPYTCEWQDWKTLPEKQEAIKYYNLL